jgi:hypothetical protein
VIGARALLAVGLRPRLWPVAVVALLRVAARGWWRHWPPLPRPAPSYAAFRLHTALGGDGGARLTPAEVVAFLEWCRRMETCRRTDRATR